MKDHEKALSMRPTRRKKSLDASVVSDCNLGYYSFKRGDIMQWDGEHNEGVSISKEPIREVVYAGMVLDNRGQQRRYLITYDRSMNKFSLNTWCSWKRELQSSGA